MKLRYLHFLLLFPILSSCFCFHHIEGESSVKNLTTPKYVYHLCSPGKGKVFSLTPYYGLPSTDIQKLRRDNPSTVLTDFRTKTSNIIGLRGEYWIAPSKSFPFRIIGLGVDYSFNKSTLESSNDLFLTKETITQFNHRLLGSANVMTLVKSHWIGYVNLQLGVNLQETNFDQLNSFTTRNEELLDYRAGYGIQYYPNIPVGFSLEAGYGGGVYIRGGITFWVF